MAFKIQVIDDDPDCIQVVSAYLSSQGLEILASADAEGARKTFEGSPVDLVLMDLKLGQVSGIELVHEFKEIRPDVPILMISGWGDTSHVVDAMKAGASDYIQKPVRFEELIKKINDFLKIRRVKKTEWELENRSGGKILIGQSEKTRHLIHEIGLLANTDATVFIRGESGTGKNLIAELIHRHSRRKGKPFVTLNCGAIPPALLESELFGHEKGAFTGALREKIGKFEYADGGTVFLDEVGELPAELQVKLLRVLQSQEFERVGGLKTIQVDVRVIAATNRDIEADVQAQRFREDLFYRLNVLPVLVPPLRERREDIPLLAQYYFDLFRKKYGKALRDLSEAVLRKLSDYPWPGNVRELQNVMERAVVVAQGPEVFPSEVILAKRPTASPTPRSGEEGRIYSLKDLEYRSLVQAIEQTHGNLSKAASLLHIGRDTLYRRLKRHGIQPKRF